MDHKTKPVKLSSRELMYLKNTDFLTPSLAGIIKAARSIGDDSYRVLVSNETAEEFRSAFTNRLAKAGFDRDYNPTSEGKILEDLIDRFFSL